jgi:hypothetical protein
MLSVVAVFVTALLTSTSVPAARDMVERGPSLPRPSFCAELETPPLLAIALDEFEDEMPLDEGMGCSESDVLQPYDIEAPVDTI